MHKKAKEKSFNLDFFEKRRPYRTLFIGGWGEIVSCAYPAAGRRRDCPCGHRDLRSPNFSAPVGRIFPVLSA